MCLLGILYSGKHHLFNTMKSATKRSKASSTLNLKVAQLIYDAWRAVQRITGIEETTNGVPGAWISTHWALRPELVTSAPFLALHVVWGCLAWCFEELRRLEDCKRDVGANVHVHPGAAVPSSRSPRTILRVGVIIHLRDLLAA